MKGWVYVISNKAMPELVKVGYSTKDPDLRAVELNNTGSPHPYIVNYELLIENPRNIEQAVHKRLEHLNEGKEWFKCSTETAIAAIKSVANKGVILENYKRADREKADQLKSQIETNEVMKKMEAILKNELDEVTSHYKQSLNRATPGVEYKKIITKRNAELKRLKSPANRKAIIKNYRMEMKEKTKEGKSVQIKKFCIHCCKTYISEACPNCFNRTI